MSAKKTRQDEFRAPTWPKGLYRRGKPGKYSYRFRRRLKGNPVSMSLGELSERAAIEKAEEINAQMAAGVQVSAQTRRNKTVVSRFIEGFLAAKEPLVSPRTHDSYRAAFENFAYWLKQRHGDLPGRSRPPGAQVRRCGPSVMSRK